MPKKGRSQSRLNNNGGYETMRRRDFLVMSSAALAGGALSRRASAQSANWPSRPVKLIIPYAPGGASDIVGRPWADALSQSFGQSFVVENRGGAAGAIGVEAASKATPDGYTFLMTPSAAISVLPLLRKTPYDARKDFMPVARVGDSVTGFVIHPSLGLKTMKETVDYAKKNPGKLIYGSSGLGTIQHMRLEMLKYRAGIDILHVPYRGAGDALNDILASQIHMMNEINVLPHVKAGKLNLLCMNSPDRVPDFPDTPTLTEAGYPNSDLPSWYAIWAPVGVPTEIADKLHARVVEIMKTEAMQQKLRQISAAPRIQTREQMAQFLVDDMKNNEELIKAANIKLE
jgi:tripartite-type tricarboxylate transporter receptor subunit TctC